MAIWNNLFNRQSAAQKVAYKYAPQSSIVSYGNGSNIRRLKVSDYENLWSSIRPIANSFSKIFPYAVNEAGQRIKVDPAPIAALYNPNDQMGIYQFLDTLSVSMLTQRWTDILVWTKKGNDVVMNGDIRADNIAGYTFIPQGSRVLDNDGLHFEFYMGRDKIRVDTDRVISLTYSRMPENLGVGISPAQAAQKWSTVDDHIADYQRGFFENGAVPEGVMKVVASTREKFDEKVADLERHHRGAGKNGNTIYAWTPTDPSTGKPVETSQIEWVQFASNNKDLAMDALFDNVQEKMTRTMGVSDIIQGVDSSATYSNAQESKRIYIENVVDPFCLNIWSQWQHELARICGIDFAISYDLEIPANTDAEKIEAETNSVNMQTLIAAVNAGADPKVVVKALNLPSEWSKLVIEPQALDVAPVEEPVVQASHNADKEEVQAAKITPKRKIELALRASTRWQIENASSKKAAASDDEEQDDKLTAALLAALVPVLVSSGNSQTTKLKKVVKSVDNDLSLDNFELSDSGKALYERRIAAIARSYRDQSGDKIAEILQKSSDEGLTKFQTQKLFSGLLNDERAERFATNELVNSERSGSLEAVKNAQEETGIEFEKVWTVTSSDPCPICEGLNGTTVSIDTVFIDKKDSGLMDVETSDGHPNCRCVLTYKVK